MILTWVVGSLAVSLVASTAFAEIKTAKVEYSSGGTVMEGYVAYDTAKRGPSPGILIVHDWMGLSKFTEDKAETLAKQGIVAFAVDIYGKGVRPKDAKEAAEFAGRYQKDVPLLRSHIRAAFDKLTAMKEVDSKKVVVIGYCFGGTTALELARSGAPLVGTVTFHGGLSTPEPEDAKNIKGRVLVLHGADDPFVPQAQVQAFREEMKNAGVKMDFVAYPGAVHAFTIPGAGNDNSRGAAYNADADMKSWAAFQAFLKEVF